METEPIVNLQPEDVKLELEREKVELEREKLEVERVKAKWTAISIIIPLLAATATIAFGIWSQHQQADSQFEIKAAELVMNTSSPFQAKDKAKALRALFPKRLSQEFCDSFDPSLFPSYEADLISTGLVPRSLLRQYTG